jgi:acetyltransferase-like isoleucine patch superfamily enzyme
MALKSLNQLRRFRNLLIDARNAWLSRVCGIALGRNNSISLSSRFRSARRGSISVGDDTLIAFKTLFLTRDLLSGEVRPVRIGARCFVGGGSTILPGVTIGDECIVGGGAVVFEDVPARSIVVGNPARVLRSDIEVGIHGRLKGADDNTRRLYQI